MQSTHHRVQEGRDSDWIRRGEEQARAKWPSLSVPPDVWSRFAASKLVVQEEGGLRPSELHADDLYLACACSIPSCQAAELFERLVAPEIDLALRRMKVQEAEASDVRASLREQLLVGSQGSPPGILRYSGRGSLRAWIRSAAIHTVLKSRRREGHYVSMGPDDLSVPAHNLDPELGYLKSAYVREFKLAFASAMKTLTPRERNVLRQRYVDGMAPQTIAALYRVHRATVARWFADARDKLLQGTRDGLRKRLQLSPRELESIFRMVKDASSFEVSVERLLATRGRKR